jgi:hypothetical protein
VLAWSATAYMTGPYRFHLVNSEPHSDVLNNAANTALITRPIILMGQLHATYMARV